MDYGICLCSVPRFLFKFSDDEWQIFYSYCYSLLSSAFCIYRVLCHLKPKEGEESHYYFKQVKAIIWKILLDNRVMDDSTSSSWVHRFCTELGNDFFCEVDKDFIKDFSNLVGLEEQVCPFEQALDIILDKPLRSETISKGIANGSIKMPTCTIKEKSLNKVAEKLYSLIHARFILSDRGCNKMLYKYLQGDFGHCPRVLCSNSNVLPVGMSDKPGEETVKVYCPRCSEVYSPRLLKHSYVDGAGFGRSFPHMFFMVFPEYRPLRSTEKYTPRLHGFKIHPSAYTSPFQVKRSKVAQYPVRFNGRTPYRRVNESLL